MDIETIAIVQIRCSATVRVSTQIKIVVTECASLSHLSPITGAYHETNQTSKCIHSVLEMWSSGMLRMLC